jgi:hypothetical protein
MFGISRSKNVPAVDCVVRDDRGFEVGMETQIAQEVTSQHGQNVLLEGYFQNELFFSSVASELRQIYRLSPDVNPLPMTDSKTLVCVHVRAGNDYLKNDLHNVCTFAYYQMAMSKLREQLSNLAFALSPTALTGHANSLLMIRISFFSLKPKPAMLFVKCSRAKHSSSQTAPLVGGLRG